MEEEHLRSASLRRAICIGLYVRSNLYVRKHPHPEHLQAAWMISSMCMGGNQQARCLTWVGALPKGRTPLRSGQFAMDAANNPFKGRQGGHHTPPKNKVPIASQTARPTMKQGQHPPLRRRGRVSNVEWISPSPPAGPRWFHLRLFCIPNRFESVSGYISRDTRITASSASQHLATIRRRPQTRHLNHASLPVSGSTPRGQPTTRSTCIRQSYPDLPELHSIRDSLLCMASFWVLNCR